MERVAYRFLEEAEGSWWYRGRWWATRKALNRAKVLRGEVLDFGAGRGASHDFLSSYGAVDAFEVDGESFDACKTRGYRAVYKDLEDIDTPYSLIATLDVVEHIEDDVAILTVLHSRLVDGGVLVVTVPAYQWLWSKHDETHKHFRRYTKRSLARALTRAGFTVVYGSYWNMLALPLVYVLRLFGKGGGEALVQPRAIDGLLSVVLRCESWLLSVVPLPFGTGLVVVARK